MCLMAAFFSLRVFVLSYSPIVKLQKFLVAQSLISRLPCSSGLHHDAQILRSQAAGQRCIIKGHGKKWNYTKRLRQFPFFRVDAGL